MDQWEPPPIDEDDLVQVLVEYIGDNSAGVRWAPNLDREGYSFSNQPRDRLHWVRADEEAWFADRPHAFRVRKDRRIDPVADRQRADELNAEEARRAADELQRGNAAQIEALSRQIDELLARPIPRTKANQGRKRGRPATDPEVELRIWHWKRHCGFRYKAIAKLLGRGGDAPENALTKLLRRAETDGRLPEASECPLCRDEECPPMPEEEL